MNNTQLSQQCIPLQLHSESQLLESPSWLQRTATPKHKESFRKLSLIISLKVPFEGGFQ
jgi:hypothetical protein